jgi:hypothetical protein
MELPPEGRVRKPEEGENIPFSYFATTLLYLRSMALVWNFHPYGTRTLNKYSERSSPFEDLNGFRYHDNWLQNMLIAASMGGRRL